MLYPLTQGKFTLIDDADLSVLQAHAWYAAYRPRDRRWCVQGFTGGRTIYLHRQLMDAPPDKLVDHINGDPLDNRRENLRLTDDVGNGRNARRYSRCASGLKGVHQDTPGRWRARITFSGKTWTLGTFDSAESAARAYDAAARERFGEFACVNFPLPGERSALTGARH